MISKNAGGPARIEASHPEIIDQGARRLPRFRGPTANDGHCLCRRQSASVWITPGSISVVSRGENAVP